MVGDFGCRSIFALLFRAFTLGRSYLRSFQSRRLLGWIQFPLPPCFLILLTVPKLPLVSYLDVQHCASCRLMVLDLGGFLPSDLPLHHRSPEQIAHMLRKWVELQLTGGCCEELLCE